MKTNSVAPSVMFAEEVKNATNIIAEYYREIKDSDIIEHIDREINYSSLNRDITFASSRTAELDDAWKAYFSALRGAITGGNPNSAPNLQMAIGTEVLRWDDTRYGDYYFNVASSDLVNDTGSSYKKTSKSFSERYKHFLKGLYASDVNEDEFIKAQQSLIQLDQAESDHDELQLSIQLQWQAFDDRQRASGRVIYTVDQYYERKQRILNASRTLVDIRFADFVHHTQLAYNGSESLIKELEKFEKYKKIEVKIPRITNNGVLDGGKLDIYQYQILEDYPTWLDEARNGRLQPIKFTINNSSYRHNYSQQSISGGAIIGFGFFGIIGAGGRTTTQINSTHSNFKLEFSAVIGGFTVFPGQWFSREIMELYSNGPFIPNSPIQRKYETGTLFGHNGFISYRPLKFFVAYKPTVKVSMSYEDFSYFRQITRGVTAFAVGPFIVGAGSYYNETRNVSWNERDYSVTLFDAPDYPVLLAVDNEKLY